MGLAVKEFDSAEDYLQEVDVDATRTRLAFTRFQRRFINSHLVRAREDGVREEACVLLCLHSSRNYTPPPVIIITPRQFMSSSSSSRSCNFVHFVAF